MKTSDWRKFIGKEVSLTCPSMNPPSQKGLLSEIEIIDGAVFLVLEYDKGGVKRKVSISPSLVMSYFVKDEGVEDNYRYADAEN